MMGHRHGMSLVAAIATLLAAMPLASIFRSWTWLLYGVIVIVVVSGSATLARVLRAAPGLQVLAMMAALLLILTWMFPSGGEIARLIPTLDTFQHFNNLLALAGQQVRTSAVPVPDLEGLLLLATVGIGLVAVLIDLAAVGIRRPALAGLPMLAIYSVPVAVLPDGVSFLSFAATAAGFLWLLVSDNVDRVRRFGRRFSSDGRDIEIWEPSPLAAAGRRLGVIAIALAVLVPFAVPTMNSTILSTFGPPGGPGPGGPAGEGLVTSVDMTALLSDNLTLDETVEMVIVRTDDPQPYYLRLGTAERLDESGFHSELPSAGRSIDRPVPSRPNAASVAGTFTAQIEVVGLSLPLAPFYTQLESVSGLDGAWLFDMDTEQLFSGQRNINGSKYTVRYSRLDYSPEELRGAPPIASSDVGARALSQAPANDYVAELVTRLTAGLDTQYDQVRALYDYFNPDNGFRYSLSTVEGDSGSPIVDFLENKRGFCVQYAAALAWLVRAAGYPARVAFGFTRGTGRDGVYSLTNRNLHAWTEVYFPSFGWVPFDATPGASVPGSTRTAWAPDIERNSNNPVLPNTPATPAPRPDQDPDEEEILPGTGATDDGPAIEAWHVAVGVGVLALLALLLAPSLQRRALRRRRRSRNAPLIALDPAPPGQEDLVTDPAAMTQAQRDAHNAWAELLDTMIDYGVLVNPAETPRATASRLVTTPEFSSSGHASSALLAHAEERARYAPAPVRVTNLDEAVREARRAFAENATRLQQLSAALFPRSVLMRWRLAWYEFVATTSRRVGQVRDIVLLVPLRRRR
ncbi:MAG: transglutaminase domain-containing protein [Micromonosporaceae bacterium]|nr:transglutaminase domain-containing protein [Micromonosporaceae bacterium]